MFLLLLLFVSIGPVVQNSCIVLLENAAYLAGDYNVKGSHGLVLHHLLTPRPVSYKAGHAAVAASFDFVDGYWNLHPCLELCFQHVVG